MKHVLVALKYEKVSSYSLKCNFCNFTLWMPPALYARDRRSVCPHLCTPLDSRRSDISKVKSYSQAGISKCETLLSNYQNV